MGQPLCREVLHKERVFSFIVSVVAGVCVIATWRYIIAVEQTLEISRMDENMCPRLYLG